MDLSSRVSKDVPFLEDGEEMDDGGLRGFPLPDTTSSLRCPFHLIHFILSP